MELLSFIPRLGRLARALPVVLAGAAMAFSARAEMGPTLSALEQAQFAVARIAGSEGNAATRAREMSTDIMFLVEELQRLGEGVARANDVKDKCLGPAETPTLRRLSSRECIGAATLAERRLWRLAAEAAAQLYLAARSGLATQLPLPGQQQADDEAGGVAIAWWARSAPAALDALARIGREWIKRSASDGSQQALALATAALDRVLREPAALHLRHALDGSRDPRFARLRDELPALSASERPDDAPGRNAAALKRLDAAARFAGALDEAVSALVDDLLAAEPEQLCETALGLSEETLGSALQKVHAEGASHCPAAVRIVRDVAAGKPSGDTAVRAISLAFEERTLTLRLLLAKAGAARGAESCAAAVDAMGSVSEPLDRALDTALVEAGADGMASVAGLCLPAVATTLAGELCRAGADLRSEAGGMVLARLPEAIRTRLEEPWSKVLGAATPQALRNLCDDPFSALAGAGGEAAADGQDGALRHALEEFRSAAFDATLDTAADAVRPFVDRIRFPARAVGGALAQVEAVCTLTDRLGDGEDLAAQLFRESFREIGLIDDAGAREPGFAAACKVVTETRGLAASEDLPEVILDTLRAEAAGDGPSAEDLTARRDAVVAWIDGLGGRLKERAPGRMAFLSW